MVAAFNPLRVHHAANDQVSLRLPLPNFMRDHQWIFVLLQRSGCGTGGPGKAQRGWIWFDPDIRSIRRNT
jgi:hypothetical protein